MFSEYKKLPQKENFSQRTLILEFFRGFNSKLMYFYMQERLKHTGDLLQIDKNQFMKVPLYVAENTDEFADLVDQIIKLKKEGLDTKDLEDKIDEMVYQLYDLSDEEISMVEGGNQT